MLGVRAKKQKKESCPWRERVRVEILLRTLLWVLICPHIQQSKKEKKALITGLRLTTAYRSNCIWKTALAQVTAV